MFSKIRNAVRGKIGVRLAVWYSVFFIVSSLVFFFTTFFLLHTYLLSYDKDFIHTRVTRFSDEYGEAGLAHTIQEIVEETKAVGSKNFFVRIADHDNRKIFINDTGPWGRFDISSLENAPVHENHWSHLRKRNDEDTLDIYTVRLFDGNILQVGKNSAQRNHPLEKFAAFTVLATVPVAILGLVGGMFLSTRALRPIRELIGTVQGIAETGQLNSRVPTRGTGDELDELGSLFNKMLGRIENLVNGMRGALDNVAHDLRTPMTRLRNTAESALAKDGKSTDDYRDALADCLEESEQALVMLKTLMDVSEAETGTLTLAIEDVDVADIIQDVVDLYRHVADEKFIAIETQVAEKTFVKADRVRLRQALANVIDNAIKYTPDNGNVKISAFENGRQVAIEVTDNGIGIPAGDLSRIWDRLYRGDQSRSKKGLGLGLSFVKAIVEAHKGTVAVHSEADNGARFILSFPK